MSPKDAEAERHRLHVKALGEDKSSTALTNREFDLVLAEFRAISQPSNATTQVELAGMKETRKRFYIRQLLSALGHDDAYAESIIFQMQRNRKLSSTGAGSMLTLDTLHVGDLDKVKIALKKECQRRWPTKDHVLGEIHILRQSWNFEEEATRAAVKAALRTTKLPALEALYYDKLLVVLSTLRTIAAGKQAVVEQEIDIPF